MNKQKSILVVDQDRLLAELIRSSMQSEQLSVRIADSVAEAEKQVSDGDPDLILIDPTIAEGTRCLEKWCSGPQACNLLAIVDSDLTRKMARRAGLDVIDKKDGLSDLIHVLRTRLGLESLPSPSGHHILVVDDEDEFREMLSGFLDESGYAVTVASDGQEALDILAREPSISVVLMDINMPNRGGLSALAEIQEQDEPPEVIMTTGISDQEIANRATELGAFDYILKPPDLQRVESTISACLSHRQYRGKSFWQRLVG